jgi:hypothetical protein
MGLFSCSFKDTPFSFSPQIRDDRVLEALPYGTLVSYVVERKIRKI